MCKSGAHSGSDKCVTLSRVVIWSSLINPAMDCVRDERIIGESNRSSPIATRNRKWAQSATAWLASRNVSPNAISIAGMCACIAAGLALALTSVEYNRVFWLIAALGAQLRLTANMLDGMVAVVSGRASKVGELYNEVPDRVSDAAVFIGAGYAWGGNVALGYIATILAIFTAYVRAAGKIAGAPNEFCGPMAKQHRMLVITVACVYS